MPERLALARAHGAEVVDDSEIKDVAATLREMTDGRGPDSVVDAVGMEAHDSPVLGAAVSAAKRLPKPIARKAIETAGVDRLAALHTSIAAVRRGGTVSLSGVYGGMADPLPMLRMFDKGIRLAMGQAHVKQWVPDILPLLTDDDPLGVHDLETHALPLDEAAHGYSIFQKKQDGAIKVVLKPHG